MMIRNLNGLSLLFIVTIYHCYKLGQYWEKIWMIAIRRILADCSADDYVNIDNFRGEFWIKLAKIWLKKSHI